MVPCETLRHPRTAIGWSRALMTKPRVGLGLYIALWKAYIQRSESLG